MRNILRLFNPDAKAKLEDSHSDTHTTNSRDKIARTIACLAAVLLLSNCSAKEQEELLSLCAASPEQIYFHSQLGQKGIWGVTDTIPTWNIWAVTLTDGLVKPITQFDQGQNTRIPRVSQSGLYSTFYSFSALNGKNTDAKSLSANIWFKTRGGEEMYPVTRNDKAGLDSWGSQITPDDSAVLYDSSSAIDGSWNGTPTKSNNIWIIERKGKNPRPLTKNTKAGYPVSVGPATHDSKHSIFISRNDLSGSWDGTPTLSSNIWITSLDGKKMWPLTKNSKAGMDSFNPVFFPGSQKIAFMSKMDLTGVWDGTAAAQFNIWTVNFDGTGLQRITQNIKTGFLSIEVSPLADRFLFHSFMTLDGADKAGLAMNVWLMDIDGRNMRPVTKNTKVKFDSQSVKFAPEGKRISFYSKTDLLGSWDGTMAQSFNLWIGDQDGRNLVALTKNSSANMDADITPQYAWAPAVTCSNGKK